MDVKACSLWELDAAVSGWVAANTSAEAAPLSAEDEDDLWVGVMERMG